MNSKKQPQQYHHGNLRQVLIDAAVEIISLQGEKELSLRKMALKAGVSHTAPYRHFKDKNAILAAVARQGFEMMLNETRERIAASRGNDLDHFAICGLSYVDFAIHHPSYYRVMFGARTENSYFNEELIPESTSVFKLLMETIKICQKKGFLKQGDPEEMALAAWSMTHGFAMLRIDRHIPENKMDPKMFESLQTRVVTAVYEGLRPDSSA